MPTEEERLASEISLILMPSSATSPSVGSYMPAISDAAVDFPQPVLPMMPMVSPGLISIEKSLTDSSLLPWYVKETFFKETATGFEGSSVFVPLLAVLTTSVSPSALLRHAYALDTETMRFASFTSSIRIWDM